MTTSYERRRLEHRVLGSIARLKECGIEQRGATQIAAAVSSTTNSPPINRKALSVPRQGLGKASVGCGLLGGHQPQESAAGLVLFAIPRQWAE